MTPMHRARRRGAGPWPGETIRMNMKPVAAAGVCVALLAACSQKTEDKAVEATGTAAAAADQVGAAVKSAGSDAVANTQAAAAKTTAAVDKVADATAQAAGTAARKADAATEAVVKQK